MAGGGSLLTVPLLALAGVEGLLANATNRVGIVVQNGTMGYGFWRRGVGGKAQTLRVLLPVMLGGLVGSTLVSQLDDDLFEKIFGVLMFPLLGLALWKPKAKQVDEESAKAWSRPLVFVVFFGVGIYAGAIQAGVGIVMLLVLSRLGLDLVSANAVKAFVILAVSLVAIAVFIAQGQVRWLPALVLSAGTGIGGYLGSQLAVEGGEKVIKPVLVVAVVGLSGRMLGLY